MKGLGRRPILLLSLGVGVVAGTTAAMLGLRATTAGLIGWDASVIAYVALILRTLWSATPEALERRAAESDESRWTVLGLAVAAALASLAAVVADLAAAKGTPGANSAAITAGLTVLLSWASVQVLFARHYAHEHLLNGGLSFPGNDRPDFPEFLYFAMTVGMTAQVSDVTTTTAAMRRAVLGHAAHRLPVQRGGAGGGGEPRSRAGGVGNGAVEPDHGRNVIHLAAARRPGILGPHHPSGIPVLARLPAFDDILKSYPDIPLAEAKTLIGTRVDPDWVTNACTLRVSRSLNDAGAKVPFIEDDEGQRTLKGADGLWRLYRVRKLQAYLTKT